MNTPRVDRVLPDPATDVDLAEHFAIDRPPRDDRPWVLVGMVQSIDGVIAIDGSSGRLGNANDRTALVSLRASADAVIVGAGTARGEGYGAPGKPGQRIGVATNSGRIDVDRELFFSGAGFVMAPESAPLPDGVDVIRAGDDRLDVALALQRIRDLIPGCDTVAAEGGPTFNGSLFGAGLVDELFVTTAPLVVGSGGPHLVDGAIPALHHMKLAHALVDTDGYQFHRWTA